MIRRWPMKRRLIPLAFALIVATIASLPSWTNQISNATADRWALLFEVVMFGFLLILFASMWRTMRRSGQTTSRTIFGFALTDFFIGLVILAISLVLVFGYLYIALGTSWNAPSWLRLITRIALAGGGALAFATGMAVKWEMGRAGPQLAVHHELKDN